MIDVFIGKTPKVKTTKDEDRIGAFAMCSTNHKKTTGHAESMPERLALLDEMLDYGQHSAYLYADRYRGHGSFTMDQVAFLGFRDIIEDWKARVSATCEADE